MWYTGLRDKWIASCESGQKLLWNCFKESSASHQDKVIKQKQQYIELGQSYHYPLLVQPIQKDKDGLVLPQQIGPTRLLDTGNIVFKKDGFHTANFIFPVGYKIQRLYPSAINPKANTIMTASIIDGGEIPHFLVRAADQPRRVMIKTSAFDAWEPFVRDAHIIRYGYPPHSTIWKGFELYGYENETILSILQDLPNAFLLDRYVRKRIELMDSRQASYALQRTQKAMEDLKQARIKW